MKNISKSFKELGKPYFKETFQLLDEVFREWEIPYYLFGANAIALLEKGVKSYRGTRVKDKGKDNEWIVAARILGRESANYIQKSERL